MTLTLRQQLVIELKDKNLTEADRSHLIRWSADSYPDDPSWDRLADAARARGRLPAHSIYSSIIREALFMRHYAERVQSGTDLGLRERQQQYEHLLELAKKADDLAEYYKWAEAYSGIAAFFMRFLKPISELHDFHRKEAALLRQSAGRPPKPVVRVSRQDRSRGRKGLRKIIAFIDNADFFLREWFSHEPDYDAVATLTEIAFPGYDVDAEDVRKSLRPTTVSGRKRASRALPAKKS
jgi:hypothetical protein